MSSILDALKRAEESRGVQDEPSPRQTVVCQERRRPIIPVVVAAACGFTVAAGIFFGIQAVRSDAPAVPKAVPAATPAMPHATAGADSTAAATLRDSAVAALRAGKNVEAENYLRDAIALQPQDPELLNNLGLSLRRLGRYAEAKEAYGTALRIRPQFPEALNNLGRVLEEQGDRAKARDCFEQAIGLNPAYADAYLNLGLLLEKSDRAGAEKYLQRYLELSSDPILKRKVFDRLAALRK